MEWSMGGEEGVSEAAGADRGGDGDGICVDMRRRTLGWEREDGRVGRRVRCNTSELRHGEWRCYALVMHQRKWSP